MSTLSNNEIAFLALANEFCATMENARESERDDFVGAMLRMLPRIYIAAADLRRDDTAISDAYVADALEEEYYDAVRMRVAELLGEDDTYLEVFEQDMKYSDTMGMQAFPRVLPTFSRCSTTSCRPPATPPPSS